ncbi:MAG: hypothetical protein IH991_25740, partial [Planctomycetes bacterium]|nr:hypothetical protein [Planctomycetota bacterium]
MENSLPPCHSRRDFDEARGLFFCGHPKVHTKKNIVTMAVCQSCSYWQGAAPKQMRPFPTITGGSRDGPCMFLGDLRRTELCKSCRGEVKLKVFSCGHPSHEETTFRDCTTCFDYEQKLEKGTVSDWAVGVTTAPRTKPTIDRCLASLVQAGWSDFRLFADAGAEIPTAFANHPITRRDVKLGAWPNWYLGLGELFMRFPHADAFMIVQDDTVLCRNVRPLLERILWPSSKVGVVSVYSPSTYTG